MDVSAVHILMYHSISEGDGPIFTPPAVFREQLGMLADFGYQPIPVGDLVGWFAGRTTLPARAVVLTFDDGFADFATAAFPEIEARRWTASVYLPAGKIGGLNDWEGGRLGGLRLMCWNAVAELAAAGVEFGSHAVSHSDLTRLSFEVARDEVVRSRRMLEDRLGRPVTSFASPYGRTNERLQREIRLTYDSAVGTSLGRADRSSDVHALPRIEMWYFHNVARWKSYLADGDSSYFRLRRTLRRLRSRLEPAFAR